MFVGLPESYGNAPLLLLVLCCALGLYVLRFSFQINVPERHIFSSNRAFKVGMFSCFLSVFKIFHSTISGTGFVLVEVEPIEKMFGAS